MSSSIQRQKIEAREACILAAAGQVFSEAGFEGARMADIARRAEIAEGTLYLYYKNKQDLLDAVVAKFWGDLTIGAENAFDTTLPALAQLAALAEYHLHAIIDDFAIVGFTYRGTNNQADQRRDQVRHYVRVFDQILRRGIDRGDVHPDIVIWQARDIFYGTLEFSARTLVLRGLSFDKSVVTNLISLMRTSYWKIEQTHNHATPLDEVLVRLARIEAALESGG